MNYFRNGDYWRVIGVLISLTAAVESFLCPEYCTCKSNYHDLRYISCVGKNLISVDLDIPKRVQWLRLSNNRISVLEDFIFKVSIALIK